ncbi:MAG TPA: hypothetical protein VMV69_04740 [Pirellulales bacterium]|nr:hypothetical protein [Pirellulales bacterium]
MQPNAPQLDEHGFPIRPTFAGAADQGGRAGHMGRYAWRTLLILAFLALLGTAAVREGAVDFIKEELAQLLVQRAVAQAEKDDLPGALANLNRAVAWAPSEPSPYLWRARYRLELNDVRGSLDDYNQLIKLTDRSASAYLGRSAALTRLNRHREAIDDLTRAIELSPGHDPMPRNNRAYARAIAGIELDEGLADVDEALRAVNATLSSIESAPNRLNKILFQAQAKQEKAMYLDTRGTLHLLKRNDEMALRDLDDAIHLAEESFQQLGPLADQNQQPRWRRIQNQALAVMYHHRGQIHQMSGNGTQAQNDLRRGQELGYDPDRGVY